MKVAGYRNVVRIREDGAIESANASGTETRLMRPDGEPPDLSVSVAASSEADDLKLTARARVVEKTAPVYYTFGADTQGIYHNARVAWELYGPGEEDYLFILPDQLKPRVRVAGDVSDVEATARLKRPGSYRLRVSTVDLSGRTSVVWHLFDVRMDSGTGQLSLRQSQ
jgi:hypothetical protein